MILVGPHMYRFVYLTVFRSSNLTSMAIFLSSVHTFWVGVESPRSGSENGPSRDAKISHFSETCLTAQCLRHVMRSRLIGRMANRQSPLANRQTFALTVIEPLQSRSSWAPRPRHLNQAQSSINCPPETITCLPTNTAAQTTFSLSAARPSTPNCRIGVLHRRR
jgi:hypothetical protein